MTAKKTKEETATNEHRETSWDKLDRDHLTEASEYQHEPQAVVQDWVMRLGLRLQGVLVSAIRGCDTAARHDNSKILARIYRSEILRSHAGDPKKSKSFILYADIPETIGYMEKFLNDCDHFPQHYVMHLLHAAEILGYTLPDPERREMWLSFYQVACNKYHMRPEPFAELLNRLGKEEAEFHKAQDTTVRARMYEERVSKDEAAKKAEAAEKKRKEEALHAQRYGVHGGS